MATTVLHQPHHLGTLPGHYHPGVYATYQGQQPSAITSEGEFSNAVSEQQSSYTSPPRWAAQQAFGRRLSKSPNIRDRTPIRHNRPEQSRHRSSSRPEMMYAYAEQQARQVQQGQSDAANAMFVPSIESTQPTYNPQAYSFTPVTSPYLHQQPTGYFEPANTPPNYAQLAPQRRQNTANTYVAARHEMQPSQLPGSTLSQPDQFYTQPRAQQMPPMPPVPSNFPPIPQLLESTPNEVDMGPNRQKPQCWDHGCNGRQFSTFSNLLRHQREKSGTANKARCPHCGTEFTRTTARNGHLYGGKCKGMSDQQDKDSTKQEEEEEEEEEEP